MQPDAVPPEVREWLASTFTRQLVTTRKRTEEKPKFRTVAHAIRAGIFVDRIYRRVSSTAMLQFPPDVVKVLKVGDSCFKVKVIKENVFRAKINNFCRIFEFDFIIFHLCSFRHWTIGLLINSH